MHPSLTGIYDTTYFYNNEYVTVVRRSSSLWCSGIDPRAQSLVNKKKQFCYVQVREQKRDLATATGQRKVDPETTPLALRLEANRANLHTHFKERRCPALR